MRRKDKTRQTAKVPPPKSAPDVPFDGDGFEDGDMATPKRNLSEDEIKEQEDRRS